MRTLLIGLVGLAVVGLELLAVPDATAIVIRHDVPDAEYVVADADYPALIDLISRGDCIGTLIHESFVLSLAHCAVDLSTGDSLEVGGTAHVVVDVYLPRVGGPRQGRHRPRPPRAAGDECGPDPGSIAAPTSLAP